MNDVSQSSIISVDDLGHFPSKVARLHLCPKSFFIMNESTSLLRQITELTSTIETQYPELYRFLEEEPQSSEFKDSVVAGIVDHYGSDAIFIKVIDVFALENVDPSDFDAVLIIHTWEIGKPPEPVQSFMDKNTDGRNKIVALTTSGEGSEKMENVDAITGESIIEDAPLVAEKIIARLNPLLATEN